MKEDAQGLDEVVVVGYGTVKKRDLTGAVASCQCCQDFSCPDLYGIGSLAGTYSGVVVSNANWSPALLRT